MKNLFNRWYIWVILSLIICCIVLLVLYIVKIQDYKKLEKRIDSEIESYFAETRNKADEYIQQNYNEEVFLNELRSADNIEDFIYNQL